MERVDYLILTDAKTSSVGRVGRGTCFFFLLFFFFFLFSLSFISQIRVCYNLSQSRVRLKKKKRELSKKKRVIIMDNESKKMLKKISNDENYLKAFDILVTQTHAHIRIHIYTQTCAVMTF